MKIPCACVGLTLLLALPAHANTAAAERFDAVRQAAYAPSWLIAGALVFASALILLFAIRQAYDAPARELPASTVTSPPDSLRAGLAGALHAGGRVSLEHAAASLLELAAEGVVHVEAGQGRALGTRTYVLSRHAPRHPLAPHETAALDAAFGPGGAPATLAQARARLVRHIGGFSRAVAAELRAAGLIDPDREATRRKYAWAAAMLLALGAMTFIGWLLVMGLFGAWPLAIPAALSSAAIVAFILRETSTSLSNEGVERAHLWGRYRSHLAALAKRPAGEVVAVPDTTLPYAVTLRLGAEWAKYLKNHPAAAPGWFHAADDRAAGYAAFVGAAAAGPPHHAH